MTSERIRDRAAVIIFWTAFFAYVAFAGLVLYLAARDPWRFLWR